MEERSLQMTKPELSSEQMKEELSVTLLADLQDQQQRDSTAVQSLVQKQQVNETLNTIDRRVTYTYSTGVQKQQVNETLNTLDRM